jgi:hypothetical protein
MFRTLSKLRCVKKRDDGSVTAQCPACAAKGRDRKGDHLRVYDNDRFSCIVFLGNSHDARQHRLEIMRHAGWVVDYRTTDSKKWRYPAPVKSWRHQLPQSK